VRGNDVVIVGAGNAAFCAAHAARERVERVLDRAGRPIKGLHAAGELVGGLFYHNYPGGSGLTSGAVFGRRAGATAATHAGARTPGFRNLAQENSR
jgi:succinate dehydrogenase/fumarate reductase flavoprotein subunit